MSTSQLSWDTADTRERGLQMEVIVKQFELAGSTLAAYQNGMWLLVISVLIVEQV